MDDFFALRGVGVDILLHSRFDTLIKEESFLRRVFHAHELKDDLKLRSIFVLKEATMKALGKKINFLDIEVRYDHSSKPEVFLEHGSHDFDIFSSVSHDGDYTIGFVILKKRG